MKNKRPNTFKHCKKDFLKSIWEKNILDGGNLRRDLLTCDYFSKYI